VQSLRVNATQIESQHAATQAAEASLKLAQQRERVGTVNMLQVLAAESAWLTQRRSELDSQARRADLSVALIKALGGGFDSRAQGLDSKEQKQTKLNANPSNPTVEKSAS